MTQTQINWKNPTQKISKYFSVEKVTKRDARRIFYEKWQRLTV
ncbi:hypothetical protein PN472_06815 [Microcystis aeruginosa CS-1036]|nr:hypothetical protein [Microcystis aeruginosa]MDB9542862.1 hypothetical protein [Microcystis aeruginosa CS-1036]